MPERQTDGRIFRVNDGLCDLWEWEDWIANTSGTRHYTEEAARQSLIDHLALEYPWLRGKYAIWVDRRHPIRECDVCGHRPAHNTIRALNHDIMATYCDDCSYEDAMVEFAA